MTDAARSSTVKVFAVPHCPEARPWPVSRIRLLDQPRAQFAIVLLAVPEQFEWRLRALLRCLARSRWALLRALPTLLELRLHSPANRARRDRRRSVRTARAPLRPRRVCGRIQSRCRWPCACLVSHRRCPRRPSRYTVRVDRQVFLELAPQSFRRYPPGAGASAGTRRRCRKSPAPMRQGSERRCR